MMHCFWSRPSSFGGLKRIFFLYLPCFKEVVEPCFDRLSDNMLTLAVLMKQHRLALLLCTIYWKEVAEGGGDAQMMITLGILLFFVANQHSRRLNLLKVQQNRYQE